MTLDEGKTFYSGPRGIRPLREAIGAFYGRILEGLDRLGKAVAGM